MGDSLTVGRLVSGVLFAPFLILTVLLGEAIDWFIGVIEWFYYRVQARKWDKLLEDIANEI